MSTTRPFHRVRFLVRTFFWRSLLVAVLLTIAAWGLAHQGGYVMNLLLEQEGRLRSLQQDSPIGLFATAFALYFAACFIPGTNGKALICGWLFGPLGGTLIINGASMLAAFAMFSMARHFLLEHVQSRYAGHLLSINENIERDGGSYLFALRVVPLIPYSVLNALMGVTPLRTQTFWWATQIGMLPGNFAFAWAGACIPDLRDLKEHGWTEMMSWELLGALVCLAILPIVARIVVRTLKARRAIA